MAIGLANQRKALTDGLKTSIVARIITPRNPNYIYFA